MAKLLQRPAPGQRPLEASKETLTVPCRCGIIVTGSLSFVMRGKGARPQTDGLNSRHAAEPFPGSTDDRATAAIVTSGPGQKGDEP